MNHLGTAAVVLCVLFLCQQQTEPYRVEQQEEFRYGLKFTPLQVPSKSASNEIETIKPAVLKAKLTPQEVIDKYFEDVNSKLEYLNNLDRNLTGAEFDEYYDFLASSLFELQQQPVIDLLLKPDVLRLIEDTISLANVVLVKSVHLNSDYYPDFSIRSVGRMFSILNAKRDILVDENSQEFHFSSSLIRITMRKVDILHDTKVFLNVEDDVQVEIAADQIDLNFTEEATVSSLLVIVYDYTIKAQELEEDQVQQLAAPIEVLLNGQKYSQLILVPPNKPIIRIKNRHETQQGDIAYDTRLGLIWYTMGYNQTHSNATHSVWYCLGLGGSPVTLKNQITFRGSQIMAAYYEQYSELLSGTWWWHAFNITVENFLSLWSIYGEIVRQLSANSDTIQQLSHSAVEFISKRSYEMSDFIRNFIFEPDLWSLLTRNQRIVNCLALISIIQEQFSMVSVKFAEGPFDEYFGGNMFIRHFYGQPSWNQANQFECKIDFADKHIRNQFNFSFEKAQTPNFYMSLSLSMIYFTKALPVENKKTLSIEHQLTPSFMSYDSFAVNSPVIVFTFDTVARLYKLEFNVTNLSLLESSDKPSCGFWDWTQLIWSTDGCRYRTEKSTSSITYCECSPVNGTIFAALVNADQQIPVVLPPPPPPVTTTPSSTTPLTGSTGTASPPTTTPPPPNSALIAPPSQAAIIALILLVFHLIRYN